MVNNNQAAYSARILLEMGRDVVLFPLWWYSRGLLHFIASLGEFLRNREKGLALGVWLKNIWRPMYGVRDWQGVLISIFMRLVMVIFRSIAMLFWIILAVIAFLIWLLLPLFVLYEIFFQLYG